MSWHTSKFNPQAVSSSLTPDPFGRHNPGMPDTIAMALQAILPGYFWV